MYAEMPDEESDEETHDDIIDYDETLEDSKSPEIDLLFLTIDLYFCDIQINVGRWEIH